MSRYPSAFKYRRNAKQLKPEDNDTVPEVPNSSFDDSISALRRLSKGQTSAPARYSSPPYLGLDRAPLPRGGCEICGNFRAVPWFSGLKEIAELRRSAGECKTCDVLRQGYDLFREEQHGDKIRVDISRDSLFLKMQIYNNRTVMRLAFHISKDEPALEGEQYSFVVRLCVDER